MTKRRSWNRNNSNIGQVLAVIFLVSIAGLGTYLIHSSKAAGEPGTDSGACVFRSVSNPQVAFCDAFNSATPFDARYSRSGDLNGQIWGVSRISSDYNPGQNQFNLWGPSHIEGCGSTANVNAPKDVRICNGRLFEANYDRHTQTTLAMYPKQPFNFANRTGTVVFDASTDTHGGHGAWPEFWITDNPIPAPHGDNVSGQGHFIRNGVGFTLRIDKCGGDVNKVSVDEIDVIRNYSDRESWHWLDSDPNHHLGGQCIQKTSAGDVNLNHFEIKISHDTMQVWATNPGSSQLILIAQANNLNLSFTQGLVWMNDVHYNASKDGCDSGAYPFCQTTHTFAWDNLGFDGPKTYRDLSYDVPDNNIAGSSGEGGPGVNLGYRFDPNTPISFTLPNVTWNQQPTGAIVTFNWATSSDHIVPQVSVNDGPYHSWCEPNCATLPAWPFNSGENDPDFFRAIAVPIPLSEIHQGSNKLTFRQTSGNTLMLVNINMIMVAGDPVPNTTITAGTGTGTNPTPPPPPPTPTPPPPGDTTPPTITLSMSGFSSLPANGSVITTQRQVAITISSADSSGIASTTATINGAAATITNNTVTTPNLNNNYTIVVTSRDNNNNTANLSYIVRVRHRDFSRNGVVDLFDLSLMMQKWNQASTAYDFDDVTTNQLVDLFDLSFLMQGWGSTN